MLMPDIFIFLTYDLTNYFTEEFKQQKIAHTFTKIFCYMQ